MMTEAQRLRADVVRLTSTFTCNPSRPHDPYTVPCIVCGKRYTTHWPPAHFACSLACALAYQPTDAAMLAWLRAAKDGRPAKQQRKKAA